MRFLVTEKILFSKMGIGVVFISELIFFRYGKCCGINGYIIREIMEMRKCSPSLVTKVKKLRKKVYETK